MAHDPVLGIPVDPPLGNRSDGQFPGPPPGSVQSGTRVATSAVGKAAQARIEQAQAEKVKEIEARNTSLAAQKDQLARSAPVLGAAAVAQRTKEIDKFEVDLQRFIQDAQAEMTGFQRDVESEFLARLTPALQQVATEKSLAMIFNEDSGLLAWAHPSLDVTAEVIAKLDQPVK